MSFLLGSDWLGSFKPDAKDAKVAQKTRKIPRKFLKRLDYLDWTRQLRIFVFDFFASFASLSRPSRPVCRHFGLQFFKPFNPIPTKNVSADLSRLALGLIGLTTLNVSLNSLTSWL
jgi:hypothetical protein